MGRNVLAWSVVFSVGFPGVVDGCSATQRTSSSPDAAPGAPTYHRVNDSQCMAPRAAGTCMGGGDGSAAECSWDSACADGGINGRCDGYVPGGCYCTYDACEADTDCPAGQLCVCHGSAYTWGAGNTCMSGNCRVDSDCGAGSYCSPSPGSCATVWGYFCHAPNDLCVNDSDCPSPTGGGYCVYVTANQRWECTVMVPCA